MDNVVSEKSAWSLAPSLLFGHRVVARFHICVRLSGNLREMLQGVSCVSGLLLHSPEGGLSLGVIFVA